MRILRYAAIVTVIVAFGAGMAGGSELRTKETTFGAKGGLFGPGTVYVEGFDYDSDMSFSFGGFLDYKLGPKMSGGVLLNFHDFSSYESSTLIELGFMLKGWIYKDESNMTFRPGFGISYGMMSHEGMDNTSYLIMSGLAEFVFSTSGQISYLGEIGITGALAGGNDAYDVTFGPGFTIRGGIVF